MDNSKYFVFCMEKGKARVMIVKIFKISTAEMWVIPNKNNLISFIETEINTPIPRKLTINQLVKYLPVENYYRTK